jgi:hypothetical protein
MPDTHVDKNFTMEDGKKFTVTEENHDRVYGTVEGEPGTHSYPAHSFDDLAEEAASPKSERSSSSSSSKSS